MPEQYQHYNYKFNSLYICGLLIIYNIYQSNYDFINLIYKKIILLDFISLFLIINIIGIYLLLQNLSFEIDLKFSIRYIK
jgi:hypothetical protein